MGYEPSSYWAHWPKCPSKYRATYQIDSGVGTIADLLSWAYERGIHKEKNLSAKASELLRLWHRIKEKPSQIREYVRAKELEAKYKK